MVPLNSCNCSPDREGAAEMPGRPQQSPQQRGWRDLALSRIDALVQIVGCPADIAIDIQESEQPVKGLLESDDISDIILSRIVEPNSGKGSDEFCQWLYESYQSGDPGLQAVVLQYIPTLCGVYLTRTCGDKEEPLAGFEAVLLALYTEEARVRGGRPIMIHLPSLSLPSLYHTPPPVSRTPTAQLTHITEQLHAPLEPQTAVKSTKRSTIVGLALDLFSRRIAIMPQKSKLEFCQHARRWAVLGCSWELQVDEIARLAILPYGPVAIPPEEEDTPVLGHALASGVSLAASQALFSQASNGASIERASSDALASSVGSLSFNSATSTVEHLEDDIEELAVKLPLGLDLLRPIFKVLGHCLMAFTSTPELKEAAVNAARALYVRASEDLIPEAILASRSLVRLGTPSDADAQAADGSASITSAGSFPTSTRRPEVTAES